MIEILISITIIAFAISGILALSTFSSEASTLTRKTGQARDAAQEVMEAVRNFRDSVAWQNDDPQNKYDGLGIVSAGTAYHPEKSTSTSPCWMLLTGQQASNGFIRQVVFENVSRDANDDIEPVYNPADNDPGTKKVVATVSWQEKARTHQFQLTTYLTNWR